MREPRTIRLYEYLIQVLRAHGFTLVRLAAYLSTEKLVELLEDMPEEESSRSTIQLEKSDGISESLLQSSPYRAMEDAVHRIGLPPELQFYVWAYPYYRAIIESAAQLTQRLRTDERGFTDSLIQEAITEAAHWVDRLPVSSDLRPQLRRVAEVQWLRFRTQILLMTGYRPLGAVANALAR